MISVRDYFPGAVSDFLVREGNDATLVSGRQKRKRQTESGNDGSFVLFEDRATKSHLPTGEKKLQPKSAGLLSTNDSTSKNLLPKPNFRLPNLKHAVPDNVRSLTFYVKFENAKSAKAAVALNGEKYGGNLLRVDSCCSKRNYSCQTTVFVGNLPYDAFENELITHFETSGNVSFVRIVRDSKTGVGKGFAFVAFKESGAVLLALQLNGSMFKGRRLRVTRVQKNNKVNAEVELCNRRPHTDM
uniref:RRM domain-containing protein n=1 Tax=Setaria digitata TaxID=48799 RepID=A0A915PMG0_9BILA